MSLFSHFSVSVLCSDFTASMEDFGLEILFFFFFLTPKNSLCSQMISSSQPTAFVLSMKVFSVITEDAK